MDRWEPLLELEEALVEIGFEEVRVGQAGPAVVVEYENARFNHNEADALQVVLVEVDRVGLGGRPLTIVVKRNGLRVAESTFPGTPRTGTDAAATAWRYGSADRSVVWVSRRPQNRSILHSRLVLAPGLRSFVGTEAGTADVLVSFRPDLIVPLWPGATGFARADIPLGWSSGFEDRAMFRRYRNPERLEYALLHQAIPVAPGLLAMASGGVFGATDAGGLGELLWTSPEGALAIGVQGLYTVNDVYEERRALTGSVRINIAPLDAAVLVRGGRFIRQDEGVRVDLARWFGDAQVGLFAQKTTMAVVGAFFTIPLTPRRDMRPGWLQVRGSRRWGHGLGTVVGEEQNWIATGLGEAPLAPWNLEASYLDWGRISRHGLLNQVRRPMAAGR